MDIERLKELAGVNEYKGYTPYTIENISKTASEKRKIEKKKGIKPGDDDWFKLWFSRPYWKGQEYPPGLRGRKR